MRDFMTPIIRRTRAAALPAVLVLLLITSGCQAMLNRSVYRQSSHNEPVAQEDPTGVVDISNYSSLLNTLRSWVSSGQTDGILRFSAYAGVMEDDLGRAFEEVMYNDAYGRYVEPLLIHKNESNSLVTVRISYSAGRSEEELQSIRKISGQVAMGALLQEAVRSYHSLLLVEIPYYDEPDDFIAARLRDYYYQNPLYALGLPEVAVTKYQGKKTTACILDIRLTFAEESAILTAQQSLCARLVAEWAQELSPAPEQSIPETLLSLYDLLCQRLSPANPEPDADGRAHTLLGVVVDQQANSEGYALAFKALADACEIPCHIVRGTRQGAEHFWNLVELDGQWYHLDAAADDATDRPRHALFLQKDADMPEAYRWVADSYPAAEGELWSLETILHGHQPEESGEPAEPEQPGEGEGDEDAVGMDELAAPVTDEGDSRNH